MIWHCKRYRCCLLSLLQFRAMQFVIRNRTDVLMEKILIFIMQILARWKVFSKMRELCLCLLLVSFILCMFCNKLRGHFSSLIMPTHGVINLSIWYNTHLSGGFNEDFDSWFELDEMMVKRVLEHVYTTQKHQFWNILPLNWSFKSSANYYQF